MSEWGRNDEYCIDIVITLVSWINDNLQEPLPLVVLSEKSGYSKWYLQKMFKGVTGMTIGGFIRNRRLQKSAVSLVRTNDSIIDISIAYQFGCQQSFTRLFKKKFNITPGKFRRLHRDKDEPWIRGGGV